MITFRPAKREQTPLMIGLAGPSRAGKTKSALRIATGLAQGRPIAFIDTESGRGLQYADQFSYEYGRLEQPFSPARYQEAIKAALEIKPAVIIVDSASHMHEGPGGVLSMHDAELTRRAGEDWKKREALNFLAWVEPKHQVNLFVNFILQTPVHFIFCFRAKDKLKLVKGKEPVHLGWTPICTDRFEYEMSFLLVLPEGSQGTPDLEATSSGLRDPFQDFIKPGVQIDEELGRRLAAWSSGESADVPARLRACASLEALQQAWEALSPAERKVPANIQAKDEQKAKLIATQQEGGEKHRDASLSNPTAAGPQASGAPAVSLATLVTKMQAAAAAGDQDLLDAHADLIQHLPLRDQPEAGKVFNECRATLENVL